MKKYMLIIGMCLFVFSACSLFNNKESNEVVDAIDSVDQMPVVVEEPEPVEVIEVEVLPPAKVIVNADVLNVRSGIGTETEVIGKVNQRTVLDILDKKTDDDGKEWFKVAIAEGEGWLAGWYCNEMVVESIVGEYYYDYPSDTEALVEDHYLTFELADNKLYAYYYGTSDDFDSGREGYEPGYYVSSMGDLRFDGDVFTFELVLGETDFFKNPVDRQYVTTDEVVDSGNLLWTYGSDYEPVLFKGTFVEDRIEIEVNDASRVFVKN